MTTDYRHSDHEKFAPLWEKTRDACAGEDTVKSKRQLYLPDPAEGVDVDEGYKQARYAHYLRRAVYYNATGRTLQALTGIAFANWPTIKLPPVMRYLQSDPDGSGVSLINQAQFVLSEVLQTGRFGLIADATSRDETELVRSKRQPLSIGQAMERGMRAYVQAYTAESILTWELSGGKLSRLVLLESHVEYDGGEVKQVPQLRELVMRAGRCVAIIWRKYAADGQFLQVDEKTTTFAFIPFQFVGAVNNDAMPDTPPLLDLANLNLAHYRNSADFEESVFLTGQPQLVISGVDREWSEKSGTIYLGARSAIPLPQGGSAALLQAQPNTLVREAMRDKEQMMAALGARLVDKGAQPLTATQSAAETKAGYSVLSLACDNVSDAYARVLGWACGNVNPVLANGVEFAIDTRFNDLALDSNAIRETVAAWQAGLVPQSDAVGVLQRLGVIDQGKTPEQVQGEVEAQGVGLNLDEAA